MHKLGPFAFLALVSAVPVHAELLIHHPKKLMSDGVVHDEWQAEAHLAQDQRSGVRVLAVVPSGYSIDLGKANPDQVEDKIRRLFKSHRFVLEENGKADISVVAPKDILLKSLDTGETMSLQDALDGKLALNVPAPQSGEQPDPKAIATVDNAAKTVPAPVIDSGEVIQPKMDDPSHLDFGRALDSPS